MQQQLALAFTTAQIEMLRTVAAPLPRSLRGTYLKRIGQALEHKSSVGDGELSRLAHRIAHELEAPATRTARQKHDTADIPGFGAVP
jgi:hypothetical protein